MNEIIILINEYANLIMVCLTVGLGVSEALPMTKRFKANNAASLVINIFKSIANKIKKK